MNRKIIFLVGAFAGVGAHAQSNVTLYGRVDQGLGRGNGGYYEGAASLAKSQFLGGGVTPYWGVRGKEDLGGGLAATFSYEQPITEASSATTLARLSTVGLVSNVGQLDLGRMQTLMNTTLGEYDLGWSPNIGGAVSLAGVSGINQKIKTSIRARQSDQFRYVSPNMAGFTLRASYVLKGDRGFTAQTPLVDELYSFGGTYKTENLSIGLAYESKLDRTVGSSSSAGAGIRYDFGLFSLGATYFDNHYDADGKGYSVSVAVPIGALTVGLQYARNDDAVVNGKKLKPDAFGFFSNYYLSKRTSLYLNGGHMNDDGRLYQSAGGQDSWAVGITHYF